MRDAGRAVSGGQSAPASPKGILAVRMGGRERRLVPAVRQLAADLYQCGRWSVGSPSSDEAERLALFLPVGWNTGVPHQSGRAQVGRLAAMEDRLDDVRRQPGETD